MANYTKVEDAESRGEPSRAKEILRGRIGHSGYDPVLFERYGTVLLAMADLLEAGKFLFLSGVRRQEYARAISLFVGRYAKIAPAALFSALPRSVQKTDMRSWPVVVLDELRALGVDVSALRRVSARHSPTRERLTRRVQSYLAIAFLSLALFAFLVGVGVGVNTIIRWLRQ